MKAKEKRDKAKFLREYKNNLIKIRDRIAGGEKASDINITAILLGDPRNKATKNIAKHHNQKLITELLKDIQSLHDEVLSLPTDSIETALRFDTFIEYYKSDVIQMMKDMEDGVDVQSALGRRQYREEFTQLMDRDIVKKMISKNNITPVRDLVDKITTINENVHRTTAYKNYLSPKKQLYLDTATTVMVARLHVIEPLRTDYFNNYDKLSSNIDKIRAALDEAYGEINEIFNDKEHPWNEFIIPLRLSQVKDLHQDRIAAEKERALFNQQSNIELVLPEYKSKKQIKAEAKALAGKKSELMSLRKDTEYIKKEESKLEKKHIDSKWRRKEKLTEKLNDIKQALKDNRSRITSLVYEINSAEKPQDTQSDIDERITVRIGGIDMTINDFEVMSMLTKDVKQQAVASKLANWMKEPRTNNKKSDEVETPKKDQTFKK